MATAKHLEESLARIPEHVSELPSESRSPIEHYRRSANDARNLLNYFERLSGRAKVYQAPFQSHLVRLRSLVLLTLVESFERYLKELCAVCVDQVGRIVTDDRLSVFRAHPRSFAAHFDEKELGRALVEMETWFDNDEINARFKRLLADPFEDGRFVLLPKEKTSNEVWRRRSLDILWQLRHSVVHNVGVITRSDAAKLKLLRRGPVEAPRLLALTSGDVSISKTFLDELVTWINGRVATRLAELLSTLHADDGTLFDPADRAKSLADVMQQKVTVVSATADPRT